MAPGGDVDLYTVETKELKDFRFGEPAPRLRQIAIELFGNEGEIESKSFSANRRANSFPDHTSGTEVRSPVDLQNFSQRGAAIELIYRTLPRRGS